MRTTTQRIGLVGITVTMLVLPVSGVSGNPEAVSPGAPERISGVDDRCPTFSWQGTPGADAYELLVYELPLGFDPASGTGLDDAVEVLFTRLPGGVSSWTPPSESRLARGANHAWFVRAVFGAAAGDLAEFSGWSAARFFRVDPLPTAAEVREALEVLAAYAELGGGSDAASGAAVAPDRGATAAARGTTGPRKTGGLDSPGTAVAAIRGEIPDPSGETYGVVGISNSPAGAGIGAMNTWGGADLVLDGSMENQPHTFISQERLDRPSAEVQTFSLTNSIGGTLDVYVQGQLNAVSVYADSLSGGGVGLTGVDAETLDGLDGSAYAEISNLAASGAAAVHWDNLTQVPVGLDDGDDDTVYTASLPIWLSGMDETNIILNSTACGGAGFWWWNGSSWECHFITGAQIANGSVSGDDIQDGGITWMDIGDGTIRGVNIEDNTITGAKLWWNTVDGGKITDGTVTDNDIQDGSLTGAEIEDGSLTGADIGDGTLTGGDIQDGSVSFIDISQNAIRRSHLDGTEVGLYRFLSICGNTEFTLLNQCQTVLCNPGPPNLFFACNGTCSSTTIRTCDNTLVGYMISPASQY